MISVEGLNKSYGAAANRVDVLKEVNLEVSRGERLAVVGASGAGKTTLMHILGVLDKPTSGRVKVEDQDVFSLAGVELDRFRNRTIGFVFQFNQLLPEFTALENVMMPGLIARLPDDEIVARAEKVLGEVGLAHRLTHKPGQLSGGEQQRVAIARALVMEPKILLADEPTGNLDSRTTESIYTVFENLHQSRDLTMIIVTHSEQLADRMDRIVRMEDGRLVHG